MNPPFHEGRAARPDLGIAMIRQAAASLKHGGSLLMVANRGLPYEETLRQAFNRVSELEGDRSYRIFQASR